MFLPVVNDVGNIIAAATLDGTLDVTSNYLTLKQMERITLTKMTVAEEKLPAAELNILKKKHTGRIGGLRGQLTKLDKQMLAAFTRGDQAAADVLQERKSNQLDKIGKALREMEAELMATANPELVQEAIAGKLAAAEKLLYGKKDRKGKVVVEGLLSRIKNGRLVPYEYTLEKIQQQLAAFDTLPEHVKEKALQHAQDVWKLSQHALDKEYETGIISQKLYEDLTARTAEYGSGHVAADRLSEEFDWEWASHGSGSRAALARQTLIRKLEGSVLPIDDPFDSVARSLIKAYSDVSRATVARTVVDAMMRDPDLTFFRKLKPNETIKQGTARLRAAGYRGGEVGSVPVFRDGKRETYIGPAEIVDTLEAHNPATAGKLMRVMAATSRLFRLATTGANVGFIESNVPRDGQATVDISWAYQLPTGRLGRWPGTHSLYGLLLFRRAVMDAIREGPDWREFHTSGAALSGIMGQVNIEARLQMPTQRREVKAVRGEGFIPTKLLPGPLETLAGRSLYDLTIGRMEQLGILSEVAGKMAGQMGLKALAKSLKEDRAKAVKILETAPPGSRKVRDARKLIKVIDKMVEDGAPTDPIQIANEVRTNVGTPDAWVKGQWGDEANTLLVYSNIAVQGKVRQAKRWKKNPRRFLFPLLTLGTSQALILAWYNMQQGGYHEDGKPQWNHIPKSDREKYFCIFYPDVYLDLFGMPRTTPSGGRPYWKITKGDEWRAMVNPIEKLLYAAWGGDVPEFRDAVATFTSLIPAPGVDNIDLEPGTTVVGEFASGIAAQANPAIRMPIEQLQNRVAFTGIPIVGQYLESELGSWQFDETTSPTTVLAAQLLKKGTGWEVSPKRIEHVLKSTLTGFAEIGLGLTDIPAGEFARKSKYPRGGFVPVLDPILRRLIGTGDRDSYRRQARAVTYAEKERVNKVWKEYDRHFDQVMENEGIDYDIMNAVEEKKIALNSGARELSDYWKLAKSTFDPVDRRHWIKEYDALLAVMTMLANDMPPSGHGPPTLHEALGYTPIRTTPGGPNELAVE